MSDPVSAPTGDLRIEVRDRLGDRAGDWDRLVAGAELPSPFLRSWWLDHAASGDPTVLCCFDGDALVGGAAFETSSVGAGPLALDLVRSLGQGPLAPDHLDVVSEPGRGAVVTREVLAWLHRPGSRVVDLDGLAADGRLGRALGGDVIETTAAPFAELGDDLAAYLAGRPGRVRSTLKRTAKRLEREGVTHRGADPADIDAALERLAALHDGRWADESDFLTGWGQLARAARAGAQLGDVAVHELVTADGVVIASELDLRVGGRVAFYQAGRLTDHEWRGSGSVLRSKILEQAIAEGATEYDLLRGDEPYKAEWSTGHRELVRCRFAVGLPARALLGAHAGRVRVSELIRSFESRGSGANGNGENGSGENGSDRAVSDPAPSTPASAAPPEHRG